MKDNNKRHRPADLCDSAKGMGDVKRKKMERTWEQQKKTRKS